MLYVRGEYQHAPSAPAYPLAAREAIAAVDQNAIQPAIPFPTVNRFTLLDTYAAVNAAGWDLSFGKQSLWWGPGYGGDLLFSNNAEPIFMFRASRVTPFMLPWIFRWLGPVKVDAFSASFICVLSLCGLGMEAMSAAGRQRYKHGRGRRSHRGFKFSKSRGAGPVGSSGRAD